MARERKGGSTRAKETVPTGLWAITCFFNPLGYRSRIVNYREFRKRLKVPLLAVELSYSDTTYLEEGDADILVRRQAKDLMWQKERLLNIAIEHLPGDCDKVAWLDCDIFFERHDWGELLCRKLEECNFVQLFEEACDLPRDLFPESPDDIPDLNGVESTFFRAVQGKEVREGLRSPDHRSRRSSANGLAWSARREFLKHRGLYDACVLGSGDRAMVCAALGEFDALIGALYMNSLQARHYMDWGQAFFKAVAGKIGCITGKVYHFWHGDPSCRQLGTRYRILQPFSFSPECDITVGLGGVWEWNSEKKEMHRAVRDYFLSRREDGGFDEREGSAVFCQGRKESTE